jgi:hypothetical protein
VNVYSAKSRLAQRAREQGVVMVITLIALVLLLVGGIALIRSSDATSSLAGQLSFRRDLKNQGERGLARAQALLTSGALKSANSRISDQLNLNYSSTRLPTNDQGLPGLLVSDADFTSAGMSEADQADAATAVSVRTVIDRLCLATGTASDANCTRLPLDCAAKGGQDKASMGGEVLKCMGTAYRISVRVTGPRSTQAFFQSMVAL